MRGIGLKLGDIYCHRRQSQKTDFKVSRSKITHINFLKCKVFRSTDDHNVPPWTILKPK